MRIISQRTSVRSYPGPAKLLLLALLIATIPLFGLNDELSLDAQIVMSGYFDEGTIELYSHNFLDVKQKPSLGLAYNLQFNRKGDNFGYLAFQGRMAYSEHTDSNLQFQLYDAYADISLENFDLWAGHHRTPVGLSSYLDSHPLIMSDNTYSGLNFNRDWGVGIGFDRHYPSVNLALTTGSGMPLKMKENFLFSGRVGWWDYAEDDIALGVSAAAGKVLQTIGYEVLDGGRRQDLFVGGVDFSKKIANFYGHGDVLWGSYEGDAAHSVMGRLGMNILEDEKLNVELQGMNIEMGSFATNILSLGGGYELAPHLDLRGVLNISNRKHLNAIILQLYYNRGF